MPVKLSLLFGVLALAFMASLPFTPYQGSFAPKVLPIVVLLWAVVQARPFRGKPLLIAAVVFSGAGDVILDLTFEGYFIAGLVSFLTAHIFYVALFLQGAKFRRSMALASVLALAFPVGMAAFLWPHLGPMQLPVAVYISVIASMLVASLHRARLSLTVVAGAVAFVISDSILALNKFHSPFIWARYAIMGTYYLAQYLIVKGVLQEHED